MVAPTEPRLLTVAQAAAIIGCSRSTGYTLVRENAVPSIRLRGTIRVPAAALETWLADRADEALASVYRDGAP